MKMCRPHRVPLPTQPCCTSAHAGAGRRVVTPLSPNDWKFICNGRNVSVSPSIGSWSLPCRSHYVIEHGRIRWADDWTDEQVERGRNADLHRKRSPE
ncbi:DUF6527 family protein [Chelatococcus sp.]|uniref:DUF6527 family protein n=1 Tax=Chelatococcus sp. TaxID=1953771 RepID=UPI00344409A2